MRDELWIPDEAAMGALGAGLAPRLRRGDLIGLRGPLGAGKSTLARGLIRALGDPDAEAPSPTFTLVQHYAGPIVPVAHFDLYRLTRPEEIYELGLEDALDEGAAVVEWPERLMGPLAANRLDIEISFPDARTLEGRRVRATGFGTWSERMDF